MTPPEGTAARAATTEAVEPPAPARRTNRTAVASFVSSVVTLFGLGSVIGIALGVYALNQIAVTGENGRRLAVAGIVVGALTLLLSMFGIVTWLSTL
jgi:hypothetical protein